MKETYYTLFTALLLFCAAGLYGQRLEKLHEGNETSIRGMSIPNDSVAWLSGSRGSVALSTDAGNTWQWKTVAGYEKTDFRSIAAFSDSVALIVSAGSPAVVLRTTNGGEQWTKVYEDARDAIFFDGVAFWDDSTGLAFGDPIEGYMQLLRTEDGGITWNDISHEAAVKLENGEAGFAASGSGIRTGPHGSIWIGTGGSKARLWYSYNHGNSWTPYAVPIEQGSASKGIFALAVNDDRKVIAVGGDYENERNNNNVIQISTNGTEWKAPQNRLSGYKSGVEMVGEGKVVVATGTSGVDVSLDGGTIWKTIADTSLHVVRSSPSGKLVLLAGGNGRVYRLILE